MAEKHLVHKKSNVVSSGSAKLPTADQIVEGELAVNYAAGYETISMKNSNGSIVPFASKSYIDTSLANAVASYFDGAAYTDGTGTYVGKKVIAFKHGSTVKVQIDATDFIKDGMVSSATIVTKNNVRYLRITWNSDASVSTTDIELGDVFDADNYVAKTEVDSIISNSISNAFDASAPTSAQAELKETIADAVAKAIESALDDTTTSSSLVTEIKNVISDYTYNGTSINTAIANSHTHSNKSVLDGITSTKITSWDNAASKGVTNVAYDTTNKKLTQTIGGATTDIATASKIVTDGGGVTSLPSGSITGTASASNTLTALSQSNGKVNATFGAISITKSQVSDLGTIGAAAAKGVDTSIAAASTSTNLPTSKAVASFVEGKGYKTTDNNTTYTFASGTTKGAFSVTPSSGSLQIVSVYGLGTAAYTASSDYAAALHTHSAATTSSNGFMSSSDKTKLDGIAKGAQVNQNAFSNVVVGTTTVAADSATDSLTLVAGSNVTLTPDETNDKITIAATNTTYSEATTSKSGLMSSSDKAKLNDIDKGAQVNQNAFSNIVVGTTTVAADSATDSLTLVAGSNVTLTPDATNDKVTIASTNTIYSAGTGISLSGTTFSNSGVRSIATGTSNGTISVNTNGTTANVSVYGLGTAAYTASSNYAKASHTHTVSNITDFTEKACSLNYSETLSGLPTEDTVTRTVNGVKVPYQIGNTVRVKAENGRYLFFRLNSYSVNGTKAIWELLPMGDIEYNSTLVDMGNGVLWARSNITRDTNGNYKLADNPEDYGCYFSWGDIVGHNSTEYNDGYSFSTSNYSSGLSGSGHNLTADFPSGNPTYDAAAATLGGNWRMPTYDECKWLIDNCNPTWTTLNGVNGELFTNPNDSSKTLFFPAAGGYNGATLSGSGSGGIYWSTKYIIGNGACSLYFASSAYDMSYYYRWLGYSVRGVQ